jgi:CRISPR-associated protein Csb2
MAVTLRLTFDHIFFATPWGTSRAEEQIEPMPSPCRLLRAIIQRGYEAKAPIEQLRALVETLAQDQPWYKVPPFEKVVIQQFVPVNESTAKQADQSLSLLLTAGAAFSGIQPEEKTIVVTWFGVNLPAEQLLLLQELCDRMTYIGRRQSGCAVSASADTLKPNEYNGVPVAVGESTTHQLLAAVAADYYQNWRAKVSELGIPAKAVPNNLFECLSMTVDTLQTFGYAIPPGTERICYKLTLAKPVLYANPKPVEIDTIRITLSHRSGLLPSIKDALPVGEAIRSTLAAISDQDPLVIGKDRDGNQLKSSHLKFLAEKTDSMARIESVLLHLSGEPMPSKLLNDIMQLSGRDIWFGRGLAPVQMIASHFDRAVNLHDSPLVGTARVWQSLTPFRMMYTPRSYANDRWCNTLEDQVRKCLRWELNWDGPLEDIEVHQIPLGISVGRYHWTQFKTNRRQLSRGASAPAKPFGLKIVFPSPVRALLSIGYGSYFGNGILVPCDDRKHLQVLDENTIKALTNDNDTKSFSL